ncbi:hypothetical protein ACFL6U_15175 [Planctomycetota bacterium]
MINHINTSLLQGLQAKDSLKKEPGVRSKKEAEPDVTLQVRYAPIIAKAISTPAADADAVSEAKEMLASGSIDNRENIKKAAENLVDYDI